MIRFVSKQIEIARRIKSRSLSAKDRSKTAGLCLFIALISLAAIAIHSHRSQASALEGDVRQEQMKIPEGLDYSRFQHESRYHARLPCLLCHRRESNSARPTLPGADKHLPCAGCHAQQFANNDGPICTICHNDVKAGQVKAFPRMKSFRVKFDHSIHVRTAGAICGTCHRPSRAGVALSIPSGFNAHNTCFRCHQPRAQSAGRDISSCATCHQLGDYSRTPEFMPAYRVNFSHNEHQKVTCNECHQVRAGMPQRRQVTAPQPLNHHATGRGLSCMSCHDGKRAFGGEDFSDCKRCHTGTTWRFR